MVLGATGAGILELFLPESRFFSSGWLDPGDEGWKCTTSDHPQISFYSLMQQPLFLKVVILTVLSLCFEQRTIVKSLSLSFLDIHRANDVRVGTLVGEDKYGNKYYEDNKQFFGEYSIF